MQPQDHMGGPFTWQLEDLGKRIKLLEETLAQLKTLDLTLREIQFIVYSYVEKIKEGVVLIQDEMVVWANKAACDILGYEYNEVINKSAIELAHPRYRDQLSARFAMVQAGDEIPAGVLWPFLSKTREIKYVKPFSYRVMYMGRPAIMSFFYDVTEDKKVQDELTLRAEILDLVADSIFLLDMKGNIIYVNNAACDGRGYSKDELLKMTILDITPPELKRKADIRIKQWSEREERLFRTTHICKDGSQIRVEVRGKMIDRGGKPYLLGIVREIKPYNKLNNS